MDLAAHGHDIPNPYGLRAEDFDFDMDSFRAALGFLGDVSVGVDEQKALIDNGGNPRMLSGWEGSHRFRRVLAKVRQMGAEEREHTARRQSVPPERWPMQGRLDQRYDPWRVG